MQKTAAPKKTLRSGSRFRYSQLHRIYTVCRIRLIHIHTALLRLSILKEIKRDLRKQSIREDILFLLLPRSNFFLELRELRESNPRDGR